MFRKALLQEVVECLLEGDIGTGKAVLRDYINATIGFEALSSVFEKSSKSLSGEQSVCGDPLSSRARGRALGGQGEKDRRWRGCFGPPI